MTRRLQLAVALLAALAVLLVPGTASATTAGDVAGELLTTPVYVDPQATVRIDEGRVLEAIEDSGQPVYVAVVPSQAAGANGGPDALTQRIGSGLGSPAVLFVLAGNTLAGGSSGAGLGRGEASSIARSQQSAGDATDALVGAVEAAAAAIADGAPAGSSDSSGSTDSGGGGAALAVLALLGLGGGGLLYARSRTRTRKALEGSRADVESLYSRLGADVSTLAPGDDDVARQALADAAERYSATGGLLAQADTPGEFEAARRTAVEGLTAARLVRTRLGLDPGPEIPPPPGQGPQLQAAQRVQVGDDEYEGSPTYAPGRSHYWGGGSVGGRMVPGGWYGVPFWETMLLGSVLSGGLGGFGGGYGGYSAGYQEGVEDAGGGGGFGGGDWGGSGGFSGGDWGGGGGGDWGGGFGGGGGGGGGSW